MSTAPLLIGVSPRIRYRAPVEMGLHDKAFQHLEVSVSRSIQAQGALALMLAAPLAAEGDAAVPVTARDYAGALDGLVLQGGKDIDPVRYGQVPRHILGTPDAVRDQFELDLIQAFTALGKPVLGICRGMQMINVAFGGSLHQDLLKEQACGFSHVVKEAYDGYHHEVSIVPDSPLAQWYGGATQGRVNSIHHQGVDRLAAGFEVVATAPDGVIEAIWRRAGSFVLGVQWHPEFQDGSDSSLLPVEPLMAAFLDAARVRRVGAAEVA